MLVDAMQLLKDEDIFLTIVGEWWGSSGDLRIRAEKLPKVEIVDRYVLEEQVAEYFSRADVVVLPYRDATGTGVIPLAYHFGKPVIASRIGGIPDYVQDGASGRLVEPENAPALAAAIREFLSGAPASLEGIRSVSARMSFDSLATCLLDSAGSER